MQTLKQAIARAGLDEKIEIRNMRRRRQYALKADRPKVFPGVPDPKHGYRPATAEQDRQLMESHSNPIRAYDRLFCQRNHLKCDE